MSKNIWKKYEYVDYINYKNYELSDLPRGVKISTMSCSAKLGDDDCKIDIPGIKERFVLNDNDILLIKIDDTNSKSLISVKKKKKTVENPKRKKKSDKFFNQVTIVMRITDGKITDETNRSISNTNKYDRLKQINTKIFKNGSIQMSGCKDIKEVNQVINKLIVILQKKKCFIGEVNVNNFKINMINCNYTLRFNINREKLYELLLKKKVDCSYDKTVRACVNVKFYPDKDNDPEKYISMFVFQKGNIIITGAKSRKQIYDSYKFLNNIIYEHAYEVKKIEESERATQILDAYKKVMDENSHKLDEIL